MRRHLGARTRANGGRLRGATTRGTLAAAIAIGVASLAMAQPVARATMIYELIPTLSVGATDNALADQIRTADVFGRAAVLGRAQYVRPRGTSLAWLQLSRLNFLRDSAADITSGEAGIKSGLTLIRGLDLVIGGAATLSRTNSVGFINPEVASPIAMLSAPLNYFSVSGAQEVDWSPIPGHAYTEGLSIIQIRYFNDVQGLPTSTALTGHLRAGWTFVRNTFSIEAIATDSYVPTAAPGAMGPFAQGSVILAQLLAGWRRDLAARWSTDVQAGALGLFKLDGHSLINPAGHASLEYKQIPWFATLTLSQAPVVNLFLGQVTVNDQALFRLALPLIPSERMVIAGLASYTYARVTNASGGLSPGYSQVAGGAVFTWKSARLPLTGTVEYTLSDQIGGSGSGGSIPSLVRQTLMLTLGGIFQFGPGTPPVTFGMPTGGGPAGAPSAPAGGTPAPAESGAPSAPSGGQP